MSQELEQLTASKQENEDLKKQNEVLEKQLEVIRSATEELEKFRESAAIERIATEARNKVLKGLGILGVASIGGFIGVFLTTLNTIQGELRKPDRLNIIQQNVVDAVTDRLSKDQDFRSRVSSIAAKAADFAINKVAQQNPKSEFSASVNKTISQKRYFVLAASSTISTDLSPLIPQVATLNLKALICQPKQGNDRTVLLVTTNTSSKDLSLDEAKVVEAKAKSIESTAYILPTEPPDAVFFEPNTCQ